MTPHVLILCTHNSARSQMAEGLLRHLVGDAMDVHSAGSVPSRVHPLALQAMAARGLDISHQRSKHLDEFRSEPLDYVITVCDSAAESCPLFPGPAQRLHWSFPDPSAATGSEAERLATFVAVRDAIEQQLRTWLAEREQPVAGGTTP